MIHICILNIPYTWYEPQFHKTYCLVIIDTGDYYSKSLTVFQQKPGFKFLKLLKIVNLYEQWYEKKSVKWGFAVLTRLLFYI